MVTSKKIWGTGLAFLFLVFFFSYPLIKSKTSGTEESLRPVLVVLSYDSFVGLSGPGPELAKIFEGICKCRVQLMSAGDAGLLMERVEKSSKDGFADVVVGVDQLMIPRLKRNVAWKALSVKAVNWQEPVQDHVFEDFLPFDWAPLTFIYREGEIVPPSSARDLLEARFAKQIAVQDPRTSSVGLQMIFAFSNWFKADFNGALKKFRLNAHSVSPSWSTAYGLFQRQQTKLAFSYVTSLAYHWKVEKNFKFKAVSFSEGHPVQVEYVGVPQSCQNCLLAEQFVSFMLEPKSQKIIMEKNFMFPAVKGVQEGTVFEDLPDLETWTADGSKLDSDELGELLKVWQKQW